jgi:DegV family protein with EDD domain
MGIRIVTDSACDLPAEIAAEHKISVVPLYINIGQESYLDGVNLTREEFYNRLPNFHLAPKTATPSVDSFLLVYERLANEGTQAILSIHLSEALSATVNAARTAAEQFKRIPVTVLDSTQLSLGEGLIVEKAAQLAKLGKTVEEIVETLKGFMKRTYVFASLKTLEYLRRGGRMNSAIAHFGEFLQIKPLLHMNMGKAEASRVRTNKRARQRLLEWLAEYAPYEKLAIVHAGVQEEAEALREQIRSYFPEGQLVPIVQITPVLGSHLGIGAIGFACVSKE